MLYAVITPGATPIEFAEHVRNHATMWRLVDDVWDTWPENSFPSDVAPGLISMFCACAAHEVNHVVNAYTIV